MTAAVERSVLVTGAGFTRGFYPSAPLLVDNFGATELCEKYRSFPYVRNILEREMEQYEDGRINLERLMTRLNTKLPYDFTIGSSIVLDSLYDDLARQLVDRIEKQTYIISANDPMNELARHLIKRRVNVITFNYDDFLDRALWQAGEDGNLDGRWFPEDGY